MTESRPVTMRYSSEISVLYQKAGARGIKLVEMFPKYTKATIYRHAKKPL